MGNWMSYRVILAVVDWSSNRNCHEEFRFGPALLFQDNTN